jgi:putative endonuclease
MLRDQTTTGIGRLGESIAAAYLELQGFTIRDRNLRRGRNELDLVATRGDLVCVVEVRLRRRGRRGTAVETIGREKRRRVWAAAERLASAHRAAACRFDVIAIDWAPDEGLTLVHVVDAFRG